MEYVVIYNKVTKEYELYERTYDMDELYGSRLITKSKYGTDIMQWLRAFTEGENKDE